MSTTLKQLIILLFLTAAIVIVFTFLRRTDVTQNITPKAAGSVSFALGPPAATQTAGTEFNVVVSLTSPAKISGANVTFTFDNNILEVTSVNTSQAPWSDVLISKATGNKVQIAGVVKKAEAELPSGTITIGQITFKGRAAGNSKLTVDGATQIVGPGTGRDVSFDLAERPEGSYTITGGSTTGLKLNFSVKFAGISANKPEIPVRVRVIDESVVSSQPKDFTNEILTANNDGVYSPKSPITLTGVLPGSNYSILIKGPKHHQKRMGRRLSLGAADNNFDWTDKLLECGDLPNPGKNFEQDGVVNTVDASLILERLGKEGADDLKVADCNYDNAINLNDFSLLIQTLSTKYDDEN